MTFKTVARVLAVIGVLGALALSAGADWFSGPDAGLAPTTHGHHQAD